MTHAPSPAAMISVWMQGLHARPHLAGKYIRSTHTCAAPRKAHTARATSTRLSKICCTAGDQGIHHIVIPVWLLRITAPGLMQRALQGCSLL